MVMPWPPEPRGRSALYGLGGLGPQVIDMITLYKYDFAFDTPNLDDGIDLYTPAVGDILIDAWIAVTTQFNGTTPTADLGTFDGIASGLYYQANTQLALDTSGGHDTEVGDGGGYAHPADGAANSPLSIWPVVYDYSAPLRVVPGRFTDATKPLKLCVSQTGRTDGDPIDSTAGAGTVYMLIATPTAL